MYNQRNFSTWHHEVATVVSVEVIISYRTVDLKVRLEMPPIDEQADDIWPE